MEKITDYMEPIRMGASQNLRSDTVVTKVSIGKKMAIFGRSISKFLKNSLFVAVSTTIMIYVWPWLALEIFEPNTFWPFVSLYLFPIIIMMLLVMRTDFENACGFSAVGLVANSIILLILVSCGTTEKGRPYFFYDVKEYSSESFKGHDLKIEILDLKKKNDYIALLHDGTAYLHLVNTKRVERSNVNLKWNMRSSQVLCLEEKCFKLDKSTGQLLINDNVEGRVINVTNIEYQEPWQVIDTNLQDYLNK